MLDRTERNAWPAPAWVAFLILFGLYLSTKGYQSRVGDQAYRLPILLNSQDSAVFLDDPFVRAFETFNPHLGFLTLLDGTSRMVGLSAALAILYALTFALTCFGLNRLARLVWPDSGAWIGLIAVSLVLLARAGNIGTNHLFGAMLLDRLIGFGLAWIALAWAVGQEGKRWWFGSILLGIAGLIHPSVGLQLAMLLGVSWLAWAFFPKTTGVSVRLMLLAWGSLGLAMAPSLLLFGGGGEVLFRGVPLEEFRLLSFFIQGPQHMLPGLWRMPQWLAWGCYPVLAGLTLIGSSRPWPLARIRLAMVLGVNLVGLGVAWVLIEVVQEPRITIFQPFRMATIARGLALVIVADRVRTLWLQGDFEGRARALILAFGLSGDWALVIATASEGAATLASFGPRWLRVVWPGVLAWGVWYLVRHDTAGGHIPLIVALGLAGLAAALKIVEVEWTPRRVRCAFYLAWALPVAALLAGLLPMSSSEPIRKVQAVLIDRCRFVETPIDDVERLAHWCRENTPSSARFIGPPGPKTFRLWSRRTLAFNRAGGPYHAEGLADWADRFRDHVGFEGTTFEFARAYLDDRQGLERRYQQMSDADRAALALRQGATHVLAAAPPSESLSSTDNDNPLELLRIEGRYAVYRVRLETLAKR